MGKIIKKATGRIDYLDEAPPRIAQAVSQAYVRGLEFSHGEKLPLTEMNFYFSY